METSKTTRSEVRPGVWLDSRRAVFIEAINTVVVGDLHWGFAVAHRSAGSLLPMWGDEVIATTLTSLLRDYTPKEMIWLGDCLHAVSGRAQAETFASEMSAGVTRLTILAGNHDRRWKYPSEKCAERGDYFFHHGDCALPGDIGARTEVIGHFHPAAALFDRAGTRLKLPALVSSPSRLILPAFSPWASGLEWNDRLQPTEILWAIAPSRIFAVRAQQSRPSAG